MRGCCQTRSRTRPLWWVTRAEPTRRSICGGTKASTRRRLPSWSLSRRELVTRLFAMQSKNEDGAISHGLGDKGGHGLPLFNASLECGQTTYRIVCVKRFEKKA